MFRLARVAALGAAIAFLGAAPTGALYITTLPSMADVWVDGTYVGHSPLVLDALASGRHSVSLTKTGWQSQDLDVTILASGTSLSSVQLVRAPKGLRPSGGWFVVHGSNVRSVSLDGEPLVPDKLGVYSASSGAHQLVALGATGRITREITIYPDMRTDVIVRDSQPARSAVVAPALDFLAADSIKIDSSKLVIHSGGHDVIGRFGSTSFRIDGRATDFDAAPTFIGGKLFLPLELLTQIAPDKK